MDAYFYDIEVTTSVFLVTFLPIETSNELIEAYIKADMLKDQQKRTEYKAKILAATNAKQFVLLDKNCSHLLPLVEFISQQIILIGFNNENYDDSMLDIIATTYRMVSEDGWYSPTLSNYTMFLRDRSDEIIAYGTGYKFVFRASNPHFRSAFISYDIRKILHLDKTFTSLKQISIILDWYRVEDYDFEEARAIPTATKQLVLTCLDYNFNDVLITRALWWHEHSEIVLREQVSTTFGINVRNESRSGMGLKLIKKLYCDRIGIDIRHFPKEGTLRSRIRMSEVVFPEVVFKTEKMKTWLTNFKQKVIRVGVDKFNETIKMGGNIYQLGYGGIHTKDTGREFYTDDRYIIRDVDVSSYYPFLIILWKLCPAHLNPEVFISIFKKAVDMRIHAKKQLKLDLSFEDAIIYTAQAEGLKISINGVGGKLAEKKGPLLDLLAFYRMTVNGQFLLMKLAEELEMVDGIEAISANTDGLTCKIRRDKEDDYNRITSNWANSLGFGVEYATYERYHRRDVNNYIAVKEGFNEVLDDLLKCDESVLWLKSRHEKLFKGCNSVEECFKAAEDKYVKFKGIFYQEHEMTKGYNPLVIPIALKNYFLYGINVSETMSWDKNIFHYCKAQKINKKFELNIEEYDPLEEALAAMGIQKDTRFYISKTGGLLVKYDKTNVKEDIGFGKPKRKSKAILSSINVKIFNVYYKDEFDNYDVSYNYYIDSCKDTIKKVRFNKHYNEIAF